MALSLAQADPEVAAAVDHETLRQHEGLEMIASENFVSEAVLEAAGSVFTNKYAEGYPGRRYYGGCEYADVVENLARDRAKQIFGARVCECAAALGVAGQCVGVYGGAAGRATRFSGLDLAHGGHLTHGHKLSFSGKLYRPTFYTVRRDTEMIDYDELEAIAAREKPKAIIGGASAYPRLWDFARMRQIADKVGAIYIFDMAHIAGLVAGGAHPSPVPHAHITTTTTHKTLRGPRAGLILAGKNYQVGEKPEQTIGKAIDMAVFPGQQGGPLVHIIAAKAVAFGEALRPEFKTYAAQIVANAKALGEALRAAGYRLVSGGTDNHLLLVDVFEKRHSWLGSGTRAGQGRNHGEQECDSVRHESAAEAFGDSCGNAGADDARHEGSGDEADWHMDRAGAGAAERRCSAGADSRRSCGDGQSIPAVCRATCARGGGCLTARRLWFLRKPDSSACRLSD